MQSDVYCCHCCSNRYKKGYHLSKHLIKHHGFQLPSGHPRFIYRQDIDGFFRLQTMRMESLEVTQQIMSPSTYRQETTNKNDVTYVVTPIEELAGNLNIKIKAIQQLKRANEEDNTNDEALSMPDLHYSDSDESADEDVANCSIDIRKSVRKRPPPLLRSRRMTARSFNCSLKNIQEFSVMKRYLKKETNKTPQLNREILIELNEVDEAGNLIVRKVVKAEEFCLNKQKEDVQQLQKKKE